MKVPYSWLKDFVDLSGITPDMLAEKLVKAGFEVEEIIDLSANYRNIVIGEILSIEQHPNATKLLVTQVNVGSGIRQIVTGAHNIAVGDYVPVCLDGARLPDGKEIFTGELRGVKSEGMFCGGSELELEENDYPLAGVDGIFILTKDYPVGTDIREYIDMFDVVLDVGVTANRPDTNSILGIAREVSAVLGRPLTVIPAPVKVEDGKLNEMVSVSVMDAELCPRYMLKGLENVIIAPSPAVIRRRLRKVGIRPINNVVDATNYVLIELGQPMHAFDATKIGGNQIIVRRANAGEELVTLDGKKNVLATDNLVIADAEQAMAIAGVMGGMDSGISATTTTILLESARFKRDNIRRTSRAVGIRTDSSQRFEKGIDFISQELAIQRCMDLLTSTKCATPISGVIDCFAGNTNSRTIRVSVEKVNHILGITIPADTMCKLLNSLSLTTSIEQDTLVVTVPAYREDIVCANDIAEEVIRLYGYDNIVSTALDGMKQTHGGRTERQLWLGKIKSLLSGSIGYHEIVSYSFVSPRFASLLALDEGDYRLDTVNLLNPLGEELSVMRTTLVPSMLRIMAGNVARGNKDLRLYEVGKVYLPTAEACKQAYYGASIPDKGDAPVYEVETLSFGLCGEGADFYALKTAISTLAARLNVSLRFKKATATYLHPGRTASILLDGQQIGYMGEVHPTVAEGAKLEGRIYVAEINVALLLAGAKLFMPYVAMPKFPPITRDLAFVLKKDIQGDDILDTIRVLGGEKLAELRIFDVYEGVGIPDGYKSVAVSLVFRDPARTLVDAEVVSLVDGILAGMKEQWGATLR